MKIYVRIGGNLTENQKRYLLSVSLQCYHYIKLLNVTLTVMQPNTACSGQHPCFVFRRSQIQISVQRPSILTCFMGFLSPFRQMLGYYF